MDPTDETTLTDDQISTVWPGEAPRVSAGDDTDTVDQRDDQAGDGTDTADGTDGTDMQDAADGTDTQDADGTDTQDADDTDSDSDGTDS